MPRSIRTRLLVALLVLLTLGLAGAGTAGTLLLNSYLDDRADDQLSSVAGQVAGLVEGKSSLAVQADRVDALVPPATSVVGVRDGREVLVLGDDAGPVPLDLPTGRVVRTGDQLALRLDTPALVFEAGSPPERVPVDGLVVAIDVADDRATVRRLGLISVVVALTALVVTGLLAVRVLDRGLRPLRQMSSTADAIAGGARDLRMPVTGTDPETDSLGRAVNRAFDARRRAEDRLRTFVADASHELRTPLSTINGWVDLYLQGGLPDRPQVDRAMERVESEVGRMRLLVDELSLLAWLDADRPLAREPVDVVSLAAEVVEDARVVAGERHIALVGVPTAVVLGDGPRIQQVLRNLVGNAVQHTSAGTPIEVAVEADAETVTIAVSDAGAGIPEDDLPRIFERFWRAEASRTRDGAGGSGLGLAIVEAIVVASGGTVHVASTVGVGTTVTIRLAAQGERSLPAAVAREAAAPS